MTLTFDETGARYYETGVSKGILFPIDGSTGVPWNGLVSVGIDPQGGESEHYYFNGVKFMDRVLAEDFQATIQAITTPKEFDVCEGIRPIGGSFGGKTPFNKRDKFNMTWRTEIGNDLTETAGYKLHIAYNCLVQPAASAYSTIADVPQMMTKSYVITATPACGRHSYFVFDSREGDLSELEAQLYAGVLPKCYELAALTGPVGGDGPPPAVVCPKWLEDLQSYNSGEFVDGTRTVGDSLSDIHGRVNNALNVTDLPAEGAYAANDSAASEVGTHPVLVDDDDATYITSADGDLGYTVGLPPLVGYREGATFELHIRASISGGVNPDDPDNLDADMQVHISTDATGDDTVGGFSDGTDEGMGFALTAVDGTIVDYVVPLSMDAWVDTTIDDVVEALEAGAYLNVVGASNNNPDPAITPIEVDVYEMSVVLVDSTDTAKYLRPDPLSDVAHIYGTLYDEGTTDISGMAHYYQVDFKMLEAVYDSSLDGDEVWIVNTGPVQMVADASGGLQRLRGYTSGGSLLFTLQPEVDHWYRFVTEWHYDSYQMKLYADPSDTDSMLYSFSGTPDDSPTCYAEFLAAGVGHSSGKSYEVVLDNATIQSFCEEEAPVLPDIFIDLPLTRARVVSNVGGTAGDVFVDLPGAYPLEYQLDAVTTPPPYPSFFVYPVDWDGVTVGDFDALIAQCAAPSGYVFADSRHVVTGTTTGGAQVTIGVDTSGWGYHPNPLKSPYLVGQTSFGMSVDTFDGTEKELPARDYAHEQSQSDLHIEAWYSPTPPPWYDIACHIQVTDWKLRFRFTHP